MTGWQYLDHLRRKPEATRRKITLVTTTTLTAIIALIWVVNLRFTLFRPGLAEDQVLASPVATVSGLLADASDRFVRGWYRLLGLALDPASAEPAPGAADGVDLAPDRQSI